ncbi:hypothetical protein LTR08_005252 [Meristemomyces frigidus]|nr:hypothetical protein LTR08_005252 [Meristemomyces frigidus]
MRLINTTTLELHEYIDAPNAPGYAILSHRWGEQEVSYEEYQAGRKRDGPGYRKITDSCAFARQHGTAWMWIDTCCIDKRSSAELSEAINSMFNWYRRACICYAYLFDVKHPKHYPDGHSGMMRDFQNSAWFTRGWTLQELLAPSRVWFLSEDWTYIGHKSDSSLEPTLLNAQISAITGIPEEILGQRQRIANCSVAQRMSWAASRSTTRFEDMAYCLLGIFNINMPLLYGEGARAFERLQAEIVGRFDDESIFAFTPYTNDGMLALSPGRFVGAGGVEKHIFHSRPPHVLTNRGLELRIPAGDSNSPFNVSSAYRSRSDAHRILLILNCTRGTMALSAGSGVGVSGQECTPQGEYVGSISGESGATMASSVAPAPCTTTLQ